MFQIKENIKLKSLNAVGIDERTDSDSSHQGHIYEFCSATYCKVKSKEMDNFPKPIC